MQIVNNSECWSMVLHFYVLVSYVNDMIHVSGNRQYDRQSPDSFHHQAAEQIRDIFVRN